VAIAYVQSAAQAGEVDDPIATLGVAPVAGHLLVAFCVLSGATSDLGLLTPAGFTDIPAIHGNGTHKATGCFHCSYRIAQAGDAAAIQVFTPGPEFGMLAVAEYSGAFGPNPIDLAALSAEQGPSTTATIASLTPAANVHRLLVALAGLTPDYLPAAPAGYTLRQQATAGGNRVTINLMEQIVASTSGGPYTGTLGPVGLGETIWLTGQIAFMEGGARGPVSGDLGGGLL
jgi:hypothetical protein